VLIHAFVVLMMFKQCSHFTKSPEIWISMKKWIGKLYNERPIALSDDQSHCRSNLASDFWSDDRLFDPDFKVLNGGCLKLREVVCFAAWSLPNPDQMGIVAKFSRKVSRLSRAVRYHPLRFDSTFWQFQRDVISSKLKLFANALCILLFRFTDADIFQGFPLCFVKEIDLYNS
jgi:hypothetical protein